MSMAWRLRSQGLFERRDGWPQESGRFKPGHDAAVAGTLVELHADAGGLPGSGHRASLELFQSDIAPVLRREIPDPPWGWGGGPLGDDAVPASTTTEDARAGHAAVSPVSTTG